MTQGMPFRVAAATAAFLRLETLSLPAVLYTPSTLSGSLVVEHWHHAMYCRIPTQGTEPVRA